MKSPIRIEVLSLLIHGIIAIFVILAYVAVLVMTGHSDVTLQNALVMVVASFFGTVGLTMNKGNILPSPQVAPVDNTPAPVINPPSQTVNISQAPQVPTGFTGQKPNAP